VIKVLGSGFRVLGSAEPGTRTRHQEPRAQNLSLLLVCLLSASACGNQQAAAPHQIPKQEIAWRTVGTYSGHGSEQSASFTSDNGAMRILWEAKPSGGESSSGAFRITIHSAISGRPLLVAVDHKGPGKGTAFVGEDPRVFFAEVDSHDLDWSFTVQERLN
jgi:hypothetical protein